MPNPFSGNPYEFTIFAASHANVSSGALFTTCSDCIRFSYSRSLADPFAQLRSDEALFEFAIFDNEENVVNPGGSGSGYMPEQNPGAIEIGNRIRITYTNVFSGNQVINAYSGRIKSISANPKLGARTAVYEALTDVDRLSRTFIDTPLLVNLPVNSLFANVMSRTTAISSYSSDPILDMVDFASFNNQNVVGILNQIVRSGYYTAHVDGAGTVKLRSRYYESLASPVASLDAMSDLDYQFTGESIINRVTVRAQPVKQETNVATLAFINQPISLPASGAASFILGFVDPRNAAAMTMAGSTVALVSGTDYAAFANQDGTGSNLTATLSVAVTTFGESAVASLFNGTGQQAWLTTFQIRGYPLLRASPLSVRYESNSSFLKYGLYEASFNDMLIANHEFLADIARSLVDDRANPRRKLQLDLVNEFPLSWTLDVGDLLAIRNDFLGVTGLWSVRSMKHDVTLGRGVEHRLSIELREPSNNQWLILDHDPFGHMDAARILAP